MSLLEKAKETWMKCFQQLRKLTPDVVDSIKHGEAFVYAGERCPSECGGVQCQLPAFHPMPHLHSPGDDTISFWCDPQPMKYIRLTVVVEEEL
jgi:hypothetical protein